MNLTRIRGRRLSRQSWLRLDCAFTIFVGMVLLASQSARSIGQTQPNVTREDTKAASTHLSGDYIGMEKMEEYDPEEPDVKWFYENTLIIRENEAILDKTPVYFQKGKKAYSAADGGFMTYRGRFFIKDGKTFVSLRIFKSDYIAFPIGPNTCDPYKIG